MLDVLGLVSAVRWYVEGFTKRSGMQVSMNLDEVGRLPEPTETALYRVVQESLTNVHRHARAASASIRLTRTADAVVLDIRDQGHGLGDRLTDDNAALSPQTLGVGMPDLNGLEVTRQIRRASADQDRRLHRVCIRVVWMALRDLRLLVGVSVELVSHACLQPRGRRKRRSTTPRKLGMAQEL